VITLLVMTDGRDALLDRTLRSFDEKVSGPVGQRCIWDDTGDVAHGAELVARYPAYRILGNGQRNGFGEAVRLAWQVVELAWQVVERASDDRFVFHLEDDFTFTRPVDLWHMAEVLDRHRYLAQMALRRQPWNDQEKLMGGVVELHPLEYVERWAPRPGSLIADGDMWLEHRLFWTTNPSLFRRELLGAGWPGGDQAEGRFTHRLLSEGFDGTNWAEVRFGYWGARDSGVWVEHEGVDRVGHSY
jgi:hypothetical protein